MRRPVVRREPLAPSVVSQAPMRQNIVYGMLYRGRNMPAPSVAPPISRQSLAQPIQLVRRQNSHYISGLTRVMSAVPLAGYPTVHALKVIRTTPTQSQHPIMSKYPRTARGGAMGPNPRFVKALPVRPNPFNPPIYGG